MRESYLLINLKSNLKKKLTIKTSLHLNPFDARPSLEWRILQRTINFNLHPTDPDSAHVCDLAWWQRDTHGLESTWPKKLT